MTPQKSICIPATPPVDIADFLPIIEHPHFQRLRERKQLGINYLVFPGAVHTRFEHAIGVLALTQRLCRIQKFTHDEAQLLQGFALLHDIGHGPFSHQIESVLPGDHHERGLRRIRDMAEPIAACGISPNDMMRMLKGEITLANWISDRNLGTDKLDYLMRDALHIGFHGTPDIEKLQFYTVFTHDGLAIEQKFIEDAKQLQKFYSYLHQHGYLNKTALAAQRMLQRAVQQELALRQDTGDSLWDMTDSQLENWLETVEHPVSRKLVDALRKRDLYKTFFAIKPMGYGYVERQADKPIAVSEWLQPSLHDFSLYAQDYKKLIALEDEIALELGCEPGDILFAAMPYFKKLLPKDLRVFSSSRSQHDFWLLENDQDHLNSLESDYLRTFAIRLVAPSSAREKLSQKPGHVERIILENTIIKE
ncbi:MAG: HD domain-containing protein [Victivallales bacterium]|nr:HD domain-containing protein [Victivallales bacterium]